MEVGLTLVPWTEVKERNKSLSLRKREENMLIDSVTRHSSILFLNWAGRDGRWMLDLGGAPWLRCDVESRDTTERDSDHVCTV